MLTPLSCKRDQPSPWAQTTLSHCNSTQERQAQEAEYLKESKTSVRKLL